MQPLDSELLLSLLDHQPESLVYYVPVTEPADGSIIDFEVAYCNALAAELTNVSQENLTGKRLLSLPGTNQAIARQLLADVCYVFQSGEQIESTYFNPVLGKHFNVLRKKVGPGVLSIARNRTAEVLAAHDQQRETALVTGILDASINGIMAAEAIRDNDGKLEDFLIKRINPAFTRLIGPTEEQVLDKPFLTIFPYAKHNGAFDLYAQVLESGEAAHNEVYYKDDRLEGWYELSAVKLGDGIVVTFTDITQKHTANLEIRHQKALLDNVLASSPSGITVTEVIRNAEGTVIDGRTILANDVAPPFIGLPKEAMLSKTVGEIDPNMLSSPTFRMALETLETGKPFISQYYFEPAKRWLELSVARMDADHLINIFTDITETKEAQLDVEHSATQLRTVVNTSKAGMFTIAPVKDESDTIADFRFGIVNQAVASYIGQTAEVLTGSLASIYFPAYKTNGLFDIYVDTLVNDKPYQFPFHYEDGYDVYFDIRTVKIGDEVLVTFTDQTDLRRLQRDLETSIEDLKKSNANLEEFAYAASHDLKEPIRKVHFFADRLRQQYAEVLDEEGLRTLERLGTATERMKRLVDDLLDYSHVSLSSGVQEEVNLNRKLELIQVDLELAIQEKNAQLHIDRLPIVKGNKRQLEQLFQNLVGNALKYNKPGVTPEITITATEVTGKDIDAHLSTDEVHKHYHLITVADNGIGFEQKDAERIFNVFQRLHGNAEYKGSGVGLSIARKVVENHQGYIKAESRPGEGATFKVYLPAGFD
ncbi:MAG: sensor signal transduction histidine kinase [Flaviaesturariibacter sp.]|nr:sensor signal transduction histidine kinase [Flaviaesturariibacter sp.]